MTSLELVVNQKAVTGIVEPRMTLVDFLRERLDLTGSHVGCEHGVCGACTVLVSEGGAPATAMRGCLMLAVQAEGLSVTTVEGMSPPGGKLTALQRAFQRHHALQCGFCTPGFLATAEVLLRDNPDPTPDEVREGISGNLCRCTGYLPIVEAILEAARTLRD